jgi:hypothetical protein
MLPYKIIRATVVINPEVAGSNPVPATKWKRPLVISPAAVVMPIGNTIGTLGSVMKSEAGVCRCCFRKRTR